MSTLSNCTSSTRPASPSTGDTLFETDTKKIIVWNGSNWYVYNYDDTTAFSNTLSLSFDGSNDSLTTNYSPTASSAFSVSMWVKTSNTTSSMSFFSNGASSGNPGGFQLLTPSTYKNFYILVSNGSSHYTNNAFGATGGSLDIRDGEWHHLAATIDGTAIKLYLDGGDAAINTGSPTNNQGSPYATATSSVSYTGNTGNFYHLGKNGAYPSYYFNGLQDEISFFKTELSGANVSAIYNSGVPNNVGANGLNLSPDAYFRCGDGSSDTNSSGGVASNAGSVGTVTSIVNSYTATQSTTANKPTYSNDVPS